MTVGKSAAGSMGLESGKTPSTTGPRPHFPPPDLGPRVPGLEDPGPGPAAASSELRPGQGGGSSDPPPEGWRENKKGQ